MAIVTSAELGLPSMTGAGELVDAPPEALEDMKKQDQPVRFQGIDTTRDEQGNLRYANRPGFKVVSSADLGLGGTPGNPRPAPSIKENVLGTSAAIGDLVLGIPAFIGGHVANLYSTAAKSGLWSRGVESTATREEAWAAGRKAAEAFQKGGPLDGWQSAPLGKLMELLGKKDIYEDSLGSKTLEKVGSAIESAGEWVQEKSDGSIPKDAILTLADSLMIGMGPAGKRLVDKIRGKTPDGYVPPDSLGPAPGQGPTPGPQARPRAPGGVEGEFIRPKREPGMQPDRGQTYEGEVVPERSALPGQTGVYQNVTPEPARIAYQQAKADGVISDTSPQPPVQQIIDHARRSGGRMDSVTLGAAAVGAGGWLYMNPEDVDALGEVGLKAAGAIGREAVPYVGAMFIPVAINSRSVRGAQSLLAKGTSKDQVWKTLGVRENKDGIWRKEITDENTTLAPRIMNQPSNTQNNFVTPVPPSVESMALGSVLEHPELYAEMPELRDIPVRMITDPDISAQGYYDPTTKEVFVKPGPAEQVKSVLLHEVMHHIQFENGLAVGTSPKAFYTPAEALKVKSMDYDLEQAAAAGIDLKAAYRAQTKLEKGADPSSAEYNQLIKVLTSPEREKLTQALKELVEVDKIKKDAYQKYLREAGEAEARAVQDRMNMTSLERRKLEPGRTYERDIPEELQNVTFAGANPARMEAVKEKGGMWHPEAVEKLARPLEEGMNHGWIPEVPAGETTATADWSKRVVKNYLNKHAGTESDPLRNVEFPMLGDGVTFGDAMDSVIGGLKAGSALAEETGARIGETVWDLRTFGGNPLGPVRAVLSHVGDYLREHVPPERLQQYDLVRAVRETAEQDKKQAAKMAKARINQEGTVDYKVYPDGMKWVEVGVPSAHVPKGYTFVERTEGPLKGYWRILKDGEGVKAEEGSINEKQNMWRSREDAEAQSKRLAADDALRNEGDVMGHCVGGYCEYVHNGDSKIYSLRDKQGMSHVTVEVMPDMTIRYPPWGDFVENALPKHIADEIFQASYREHRGSWQELLKDRYPEEYAKLQSPSITQIKGKQNRAPVDKYLPYVQDFVKSGKWGDVGDLQNAGLYKAGDKIYTADEAKSLLKDILPRRVVRDEAPADRALAIEQSRGVIDRLQGGTLQEALTRWEPDIRAHAAESRIPPGDRGSIDPRLLKGLAATGLGALAGAYLNKDDPIAGALMGAVAGAALGTPAMMRMMKGGVEKLDDLGGSLSTRLGNLSPAVKLRARDHDRSVAKTTHQFMTKVVPFMKNMEKLKGQQRADLENAILTNDGNLVRQLMQATPELAREYQTVRSVLDGFGAALQGHGRFRHANKDYFPRVVKDYPGLMEAISRITGAPQLHSSIEAKLAAGDAASMRAHGVPMSDLERGAMINKELGNFYHAQGYLMNAARKRSVHQITDTLRPFYHSPNESLFIYIKAAVTDLETVRFFGRDLVSSTAPGGQKYTNVAQSIGNTVGTELRAGNIKPEQVRELEGLLQARFGPGERSTSKGLQDVRNVMNLTLLGNPLSAATQLADLGMPVYAQGLRSTLTAVARTVIPGGRKITTKDMGLADHIAEEFVTGGLADIVNKIFKIVGFTGIDQAGKNLMINSALDRYTRLSKTVRGERKIAEKYRDAYGNQYPALIEDLRANRLSERVELLLWSELADYQPISKVEQPKLYLEHPDARPLWMLKTFMLKQADIIRRDTYNKVATGEPKKIAEGLKNLTAYLMVLGVGGATADMIKDWLLGRKATFELGDVVENMLKTFSLGEYTRDKMKNEPLKAVANALLPPTQIVDKSWKAVTKNDPAIVEHVPIVGKHAYNLWLGGNEKWELRQQQKDKKAGESLRELSPAAVRFKEMKKQEAKAKRDKKKVELEEKKK